jgi:hypothetical protein
MEEISLKKALDDYKTIYMPYRNFVERTRVDYISQTLLLNCPRSSFPLIFPL